MVVLRRLLVVAVALLLAALIIRVAALRALPPGSSEQARIWAGHPDVQVERGLIAIAEAARQRRPVDPATLDNVYAAARSAPLAEDPYLVRGVQAQVAGDNRLAEQAFRAARHREGRSLAARYFLADLYLRNGDAKRGLGEIAVLARLTPDGVSKLAPYVATYARDRRNWPGVRMLFAREPVLEETSLRALAADPRNAETVLALSDPRRRKASSPWLADLIGSLTEAGQYAKARRVWSEVAGVTGADSQLIFDPQFQEAGPPPPFNWQLTSSAVGIAERQAGRGLHVIFHGQQDGALASQQLVLPPGRYRLGTDAPNPPTGAGNLRWNLTCARGGASLASATLDRAIQTGLTFTVPAGCSGQRLELAGSATDMARQTDMTIRSVSLSRESAGG